MLERIKLRISYLCTYQVTETMDQIISFIQKLVDKGYAYVVDGDVSFRVSKVKEYGELSGIKIEDLVAGKVKMLKIKVLKEKQLILLL